MSSNAVRIFKRKLTNLSSANPQLWITRLKADIHFDYSDIEFAGGGKSWDFLDLVLSGQKKIVICPLSDPRDSVSNQMALKLGTINRKQKLVFQERGVDELFISFPFIQGQWPDGSWVRTPFLCIPARLEKDSKNWNLFPSIDEAFINPSFLLAYSFHFKRPLDEKFYEKEIDISASDAVDFLTQFYNKLKESQIEILFNQDLFMKNVDPFQAIVKDNLPTGFKPGMLKLIPNCVLGLFPQGDSLLVPDFEYLESNLVSLEDVFFKQIEVTVQPGEKNMLSPLPVDGSQEEAIRKVKSGKSIVVQGPPGTGKSQLISNLMADAMGSGHSVLLVCQKRVALEVVQRRLNEVGLGQYVGLWSDFKKDREPVYLQMSRLIDQLEETESKNQNLDTVILERSFTQACNQIEQISQRLEAWKTALFDNEFLGVSIRDLYNSEESGEKSNFETELFLQFKAEEWNQFLVWLSRCWEEVYQTTNLNFPFKDRKNWYKNGEQTFSELPKKWESICTALSKIDKVYASICKVDGLKKPFNILLQKKVLIEAILHMPEPLSKHIPFVLQDFKQFVESENRLILAVEKWRKLNAICLSQEYWPDGFLVEYSKIDSQLTDIEKVENYFGIGFIKPFAILLNKRAARVAKAESYFPKSHLRISEVRKSLTHAISIIDLSNEILLESQSFLDRQRFYRLNDTHREFLDALSDIKIYQKAFSQISKYLISENLGTYDQYYETIEKLGSLNIQLEKSVCLWNLDFKIDYSTFILSNFNEFESFLQVFSEQKSNIWFADQQLESVPEHWRALALEISSQVWANKDWKSVLAVLKSSWNHFWINRIESKNPDLSKVGDNLWQSDLSLLRESIVEKEKLVSKILNLRLSESTYKNLEFNRLGNRLTYRNLYHQLTKKRMRPPLRKLWADHELEIKRLIPAWLATPESVSATWPMDTKFDLVIFDESSQCFAERGIPAAYRGRQLVVVGDEMQLSPNQLFSSRWDEDGEDEGLLSDQNSLLDLAKQFLPQTMLKGHYRSAFPELISFSNANFYQNKLQFFPHSSAFQKRKSSLIWRKCDGLWVNQQNVEEAELIATEIFSFFEKYPGETLGIITFNARQQILIEKEIENKSIEKSIPIPDWLFVKNIENVQGDERDHIWFSIAYGKNEKNKVVAQFGSLSQSGGENRLNVAITRARKSITLFSSIMPNELPISESAGKGPRLLQAYLLFVFNASRLEFIDSDFLQFPADSGSPIQNGSKVIWQMDDGSGLFNSGSVKDFFGFKFLSLSQKGYHVEYQYSGENLK